MENNFENEEVEKAKQGDIIEFKPYWSSKKVQGSVAVVKENSVIVQLKTPKKTEDVELKNTVVNHKNYRIIKSNN